MSLSHIIQNPNHKIGFLGAGNMTTVFLRRLIESNTLTPKQIMVSNRTDGKLQKLKSTYDILIANTNEQLVDECDVVIIAVKPQDFNEALEPIASSFKPDQIVISLAAGLALNSLYKIVPNVRWARVMPNTPSRIGHGVIGLCTRDKKDVGLEEYIKSLLASLGTIISVESEEDFNTIMISSSSGTGFVFELMSYWQEWIEERGFTAEEARQITVETFFGASLLAQQSPNISFVELVSAVASKKGVTAAGLDSMRETEVERALRISFEKAWIRNQEIAKLV